MQSPRRRVLLLAGVAIAVLVLVAVAILRTRRHERLSLTDNQGRQLLPFEPNRLPEHASSIVRMDLRELLGAREPNAITIPEQALWSYFAESLCGGHDVYRAAMDVALSWRHLRRFRRILTAPAPLVRDTLACGKELADRIDRPGRLFLISLDVPSPGRENDGTQLVQILPFALATMPASSRMKSWDPVVGLESGCAAPLSAGGRALCADFSIATARHPKSGAFVHGTVAAVEAFGRDTGGHGYDLRDGAAVELAQNLREYARVEIRFDARTLFPPPELPFPLSATQAMREIRSGLQSDLQWGVHAAAEGHKETLDGEAIRVVLVAKGNDEAARLHSGMLALRDALRPALDDKSKHWPRQDGPREESDYLAFRALAGVSAWKTVEIVREGTTIVFDARLALDKDEPAARRFRSWRAGHALAAARLVDELIAGRPVRSSDLEPLHGAELVRRTSAGYKPFFAGDWACWQDGENKYWSFIDGKAYRGKERTELELEGTFVYQVDDRSGNDEALLSIDQAGGKAARLRIETTDTSSGILLRRDGEPWSAVVSCSSVGDEADHEQRPPPDSPGTIAPVSTWFPVDPASIKSDPDPEWTDSAPLTIKRDGFLLELAIGGALDGHNVSAIRGDGHGVYVYGTTINRSWGIDTQWRRVEFTLTDTELGDLIGMLNDIRFLALPRSYVNEGVVDGATWTIHLHTGGRLKRLWLANAFPEPLLGLARKVAGFIDARPELDGLSRPVLRQYAFDSGEWLTAVLRPEWVNEKSAHFELSVVDRSLEGREIAHGSGSWTAGGVRPVEGEVSVQLKSPVNALHRYDVVARMNDGQRMLVGSAPALTDGYGQSVEILLREARQR